MKMHRIIPIVLLALCCGQLKAVANLPEGYAYVFPPPVAKYVSPSSTIILRFTKIDPSDLDNLDDMISVSGSKSGLLSGETIIASDKQTVIFKTANNFAYDETISVTIAPHFISDVAEQLEPLTFRFTVLNAPVTHNSQASDLDDQLPVAQMRETTREIQIMANGVSVPGDFPHVEITQSNNPSSDYVFLNNWGTPNYNIIFNTSGEPVWYLKTADRRRDFKQQPNGWITMLVPNGINGSGMGFAAFDQNFEFIKTFHATNDYWSDEHELQVLPDSGYLLIGQRETIVNMSQYVQGGHTSATVRETCIQEFTADDQLIFIWRAWDHFDIRDLELESLINNYIRFPHMNAIDIDEDEHILLSSRHLSEITKINRQTGGIIWRLCGVPGSENNDFEFVNDPLNGFRNQHSIRSLGNNNYTIFDNGNLHTPPLSRAVEYHIDTTLNTATLYWEFQNDVDFGSSFYMGNAQRLDNGNTHINWAVGNIMPIASEITHDGEKAFEMFFSHGYHCYRSFRFPWTGVIQAPYLLLEPQFDNLTLLFNKFGDDQVEFYNVYGDTVSQSTTLMDTSGQTLKELRNLVNGKRYYFRVTAVDSNGIESAFSNEESSIINIIQPGTNMVVNGDFSDYYNGWIWGAGGGAAANWLIEDGVSHLEILNGGSQVYDVQLRQNNIQLIQGQDYTFEFDAWASEIRYAEIKVGQETSPYINYSRIGYTVIMPTNQHYSFRFEMQEPGDSDARVVINAGTSEHDLYIDNISLIMDTPTDITESNELISDFRLYQNYPNPFNPSTSIEYYVPEPSWVNLTIYNTLGQEVGSYVDAAKSTGRYRAEIDLREFNSGIYFYALEALADQSTRSFRSVQKMILLK